MTLESDSAMKTIGVDPACEALARYFLVAEPITIPISAAQAARNLQSLSETIQQAVEDWFIEEAASSERRALRRALEAESKR